MKVGEDSKDDQIRDKLSSNDIWNIDYQAILPLRCLLSKGDSSWEYFQTFTDHCEVSIKH